MLNFKQNISSYLAIMFLVLNTWCIQKFSAQENENELEDLISGNKYLNYLLIPDSSASSSLLFFQARYLFMPKSNVLRWGGMHYNFGINISRFFSKKILLGISWNAKIFPGLTKQYFSQDFINDFNYYYNASQPNSNDSLRADILYKGINGLNNYRFRGSAFDNLFISFSPFPQKYGGIMLQFGTSSSYFPIYGKYPTEGLTKDNDPVDVYLAKDYCFELNFKPYKFFSSGREELIGQSWKGFYKYLIICFYYQKFNLQNATFNQQSLTRFVDQKFIDKYSSKNYFGFKIGYGLY
ncbi:MAG: hypothetical protein IT236_18975 [Bacteroidia bacterium]|nr:hypothetical protein [Bacteroidia bacterium]